MRSSLRTIASVGGAAALAVLGGCQSQSSTRVTVMNESSTPLLVDVAMADSESYVYESVPLDMGGSRAFMVEHSGADVPVQVGVRPSEFDAAAAQWLEFDALAGPYLLRVQGSATSLRYVPSKDTTDLDVQDVRPPHEGRLGGEPPIKPR